MSTNAEDILDFRGYSWKPLRERNPYAGIEAAGAGFAEDEGVEFSDYAKLVMSGGANIGRAAGWLMKTLGAEEVGASIEEMGASAVDYWHDSLTPAMQTEISKQIIRKDEHSGEYEWGDPSWTTVLGMGAESLLGTAAGMGAGAGLTKVLQVFANPFGRSVLQKAAVDGSAAAAKKLKLVDTVLGATGFGAGEGAVGGISAGASVYDNVMRLPAEKLMQNPRYRQVYESTDTSLSELERHQYAADTVAKEASSSAGWQSGLTTALLGAPMGAYFGRILGGAKLSSTLPRGIATGAAGEAAQEFAQSGVEQLISNVQTQPFDPDLDTFEGILNAAVGGALAGGLMGGAFGVSGVGAARQEVALEEAEKRAAVGEVGGDLLRKSVETMEAAATSARNSGASGRQILAIVGEVTAGRMELEEGINQLEALKVEARTGQPAAEILAEQQEELEPAEGEVEALEAEEPVVEAPPIEAVSQAPEEIEAAAAESPLSPQNDKPLPTPKQLSAGNYEKPQVQFQGFKIRIENPAGSKRKKTSRHGVAWEVEIQDNYGYIEGTKDRDGDAMDVYQGTDYQATNAYVVNQVRMNGDFDEHKVMLGYGSLEEAKEAYLRNYPEGHPAHQSEIVQLPVEKFRQWAKAGDTFGRLRVDEQGNPISPPMGSVQESYAGDIRVETQFQLREADEVVTSHTLEGAPVPYYPASFQPRDRSRQASKEWIVETAGKFAPEKITGGGSLAEGAPLIDPDGIVESGNGRILLLRHMYEQGVAEKYKNYLKENAEKFGIKSEDVDTLERPALVRVRQTELTQDQVIELARVANQPEVAGFSAAETARVDADRLPDSTFEVFAPDQSGNVLAATNNRFVSQFLQTLPASERGRLITADGQPTKQLADRITAAVFQKAYQSDRILHLMAEEADPGIRNIINALTIAAPSFARARAAGELGELDVTVPLVDAIDVIRQSRAQGIAMSEFIAQQGLFGSVDPLVGDIATFMDKNMRSAKRMGEAFTTMGSFIEREMTGARTGGLFGDEMASLRDVVKAANREMSNRYGTGAGIPMDMFAPPEPEPVMSRRPLRRDVTLTEQYEVEETGELVEIEERASVLINRLDKRIRNIERLGRCVA